MNNIESDEKINKSIYENKINQQLHKAFWNRINFQDSNKIKEEVIKYILILIKLLEISD